MSNTIQSKGLATTPLSTGDILAIVQGGVLKRTTVGDLPEGATVIDNANGIAIRFPTGIQICWTQDAERIETAGVAISTASAGGFRSTGNAAGTWTFPAAFSANPYFNAISPGTDYLVWSRGAVTTTDAEARVWRVTTSASQDVIWYGFAIGTWSA